MGVLIVWLPLNTAAVGLFPGADFTNRLKFVLGLKSYTKRQLAQLKSVCEIGPRHPIFFLVSSGILVSLKDIYILRMVFQSWFYYSGLLEIACLQTLVFPAALYNLPVYNYLEGAQKFQCMFPLTWFVEIVHGFEKNYHFKRFFMFKI